MINIDQLAAAVMQGLQNYAKLSTEGMKEAVKKAAKLCKSEITANAPRNTGAYKKSWTTRTTGENSNSLQVTVYSKQSWLPHLLEHGHAKRNGGRVAAQPHIAPAEEKAAQQLERDIRELLEEQPNG